MTDKKLIVNDNDLKALHNQLCVLHPTGDDIISVANAIMTLRRMIEGSPEYAEPEVDKSAEEKNVTD